MANRTLTANSKLRETMENNNVKLWQLADALGTRENYLCAKLRHELSDTEKRQMLKTIKTIASKKN